MPEDEFDHLESDVPQKAVDALNAAHQQAMKMEYPLILVRNGQLIRATGDTITVLKTLPARKKVTVLQKSARS